MPSGGARQHKSPGRPKGTTGIKHATTLSKEQAREVVRQMVMAAMQPMVEAQVAHAQGLKYLVIRDAKTGKFTRVTKQRMDELLDTGGDDLERVEVWEKDPSVQAFTDLLNRALDKPKEQEQAVKVDGKLEITINKPW